MKQKIYFIILSILIILGSSLSAHNAYSKEKLTILLSNDDGYNAPGIKALAKSLSNIANIHVSAPLTQQSGTGHGFTYREPIFINSIKNENSLSWHSVSAKPATCVRIGVKSLLKQKPDLVISGINSEPNLGLTIYYSGTVGAAREAAILKLPAIAVSTEGNNDDIYKEAANYIKQLVTQLEKNELIKPDLFLNINIPTNIVNGVKGIKITKLSNKSIEQNFEKRISPSKQIYFWNKVKLVNDPDISTDINAYENGFITITPLTLNQSNSKKHESFGVLTKNKKP